MASFVAKAYTTDQGSEPEYHENLQPKIVDGSGLLSTNRSNKLPVNLFHTSSEYSKMLITNGKCLKQKQQTQIDGFYDDLQFINDPLFQSTEQKQLMMKQKITTQPSTRKRAHSSTIECSCCCCDNYCIFCQQSGQKSIEKKKKAERLTNEELKKAVEAVQKKIHKNLKKKKNKIISLKYGLSKDHIQDSSEKINGSEKNESSSSYLSHKNIHIQKLVCNSLILFEERKREEKIRKIRDKNQRIERKSLIKQLNDEIRQGNREQSLSREKSTNNVRKSKTKADIRMDYWSSIKGNVATEIIKTKLSGGANLDGIKPKKIQINCNHKSKLSPQKMQELKKKHEKEAKMKISKEKLAKSKSKKRIESNLKKVKAETQKIIKQLPKKAFKPSQKMIQEAFINIA